MCCLSGLLHTSGSDDRGVWQNGGILTGRGKLKKLGGGDSSRLFHCILSAPPVYAYIFPVVFFSGFPTNDLYALLSHAPMCNISQYTDSLRRGVVSSMLEDHHCRLSATATLHTWRPLPPTAASGRAVPRTIGAHFTRPLD
jgi:hypothetical protein